MPLPRPARAAAVLTALLLAPAARGEDHLRIGSWNIQNLGERDFGQSPKALSQHIQLAGVDLLALQEIHDDDGDPGTRTNTTLDRVLDLLSTREGHTWTYVLFPRRDPRETLQLVGVAWNAERVSPVGDPVPIDVDHRGALWSRHPYAMKFSAGSGRTDIVVVVLHMKSNVDGERRGRSQRAKEARALAARLGAVREHFDDEDLVLIGDTNCLDARETALQAFRAAGLRDLNAEDVPTYRTGRSPLDRILVPREQPEFRFARQYVLVPADAARHAGKLSDHFVVMAALRILRDDD